MSFTKLLATGKSLIGMKDQDCPYRMRRENLLPKFESTKNPFAIPAKIEPVATVPAVPAKIEPRVMETSSLFDAELKPAVLPVTQIVPVNEMTPALVQPVAVKVLPKAASPVLELPVVKAVSTQPAIRPSAAVTAKAANIPTPALATPAEKATGFPAWMKKVNPLSYLQSRHSGDEAGRSKSGRTAVQTELSLEKVKVMRNELNDTDLELVAVPAAGKAASGRTKSSLAGTEPTTFNRLTARFFGAGQAQV